MITQLQLCQEKLIGLSILLFMSGETTLISSMDFPFSTIHAYLVGVVNSWDWIGLLYIFSKYYN